MRYPETASLIRKARLRTGLSQERAAVAVGCSRLQFIRWEQGLHRPDANGHAARLVTVLGIDEKALIAADDEEESQPMASELFAQAVRAVLREELRRVPA